ncbi:MAG: hypothetical protein KC549_18980, partial [Myxococcales bacterium]|nr:hypothetical protein [Myxococcales bacterium]
LEPVVARPPMEQPTLTPAGPAGRGTDPRRVPARPPQRRGLMIGLIAGVVLLAAAAVVLLVLKPFGGGPAAAPVGPPKLTFASQPEGVEIFHNGRFIGETPVTYTVKAPSEIHDLQVATRTRTFQVKVPAVEGPTWVFVQVPPDGGAKALGFVTAISKPAGAQVKIDGVDAGQTPLVVIGAADADVELAFDLAGKQTKSSTRTAAAGERVEVTLE